jgi:hypothetical protein
MFSDLDDLALVRILSYCKAGQLLNISLLSTAVRNVSRSNELWDPHLEKMKIKYCKGCPKIENGSPLLVARLSFDALRKQVSVKALKELASLLQIPAAEVSSCSEKSEICRLVYDRQLRMLGELESRSIRSAYEKEWDHPIFAGFWCFRRDLSRTYMFEHEVVEREWGMYWRPREAGIPPQFHTTVKFHADGSFSGEDPQLTSMNEGKTWTRSGQGVTVGPYPTLVPTRTPKGGWRLTNPHVLMLSDVNYANGYHDHFS